MDPKYQTTATEESVDDQVYVRRNDMFRSENLSDAVEAFYPEKEQLLKQFTVICLIVNRMIGTGIFSTPSTVAQYTDNVLVTMLFWICGCVMALAGILLYREYGLHTPRYYIDGQKTAMPRSGGDLNYLKYIFNRPPFYAVCLFGITFVLIGNVATNSMSFGINVIEAAGRTPSESNWEVRGVAILVCTAACALHAYWRTGGIYLNNIFAVVKAAILIMIIITGFLAWGNVFPTAENAAANLQPSGAFSKTSNDPYGFAEAYLAIVFAFGGLNQANFVLGEVDNPRKRYKWPAFFAVFGVCVLYILVNIAYMVVVPKHQQFEKNSNVAILFFELTYGRLSNTATAARILRSLMAISSLGNIIVMTFTAARVKQEIAKEGILPFRKFLASSVEVRGIQISRLWGAEKQKFSEWVPFGALCLHWAISVILILATGRQHNPEDSYSTLVNLYSYNVDSVFGVCIAAGMLYLRFPWSGRNWRQKSDASPFVSILAAVIYGIANLFPVVAMWYPPTSNFVKKFPSLTHWYIVPTVSWAILVFATLWWVGYYYLVPLVRHPNKVIKITREVDVDNTYGYDISTHERIYKDWLNAPEDGEIDGAYQHEDVICIRRNRQYGA